MAEEESCIASVWTQQPIRLSQSHVHITPLLLNSQLDSFTWSMVIPSQSHDSSAASVLSDIPTHSFPVPGLNSSLLVMSVVS